MHLWNNRKPFQWDWAWLCVRWHVFKSSDELALDSIEFSAFNNAYRKIWHLCMLHMKIDPCSESSLRSSSNVCIRIDRLQCNVQVWCIQFISVGPDLIQCYCVWFKRYLYAYIGNASNMSSCSKEYRYLAFVILMSWYLRIELNGPYHIVPRTQHIIVRFINSACHHHIASTPCRDRLTSCQD